MTIEELLKEREAEFDKGFLWGNPDSWDGPPPAISDLKEFSRETALAAYRLGLEEAKGCVPKEETMRAALESGSDAGAGHTIGHNYCVREILKNIEEKLLEVENKKD